MLLPPPHQRSEDTRRQENADAKEQPYDSRNTTLQGAAARLARIVADRDRHARSVPSQDAVPGTYAGVQPPAERHASARVPAAVHTVLVQDGGYNVRRSRHRNPPAVRLGVQNPPRRRGPVCAATREPDLPDEVPGRHSEGEEPDKRRNDPFDERHDLGSLRRLVLLRSPGWFGSHIYGAFLRTSSNAHHPVTFRTPLAGTHSVYAELADDPTCTGNVLTE